MKKIRLTEPILEAVDETNSKYMKYMIQMTDWAKYIERKIGSYYGYPIKAKLFTVTGCTIDLPTDCYRPLMILPGDYEDECNAHYAPLGLMQIKEDVRDDEVTLLWIPMNITPVVPKYWTERGEQLDLITKYEDQQLTLVYQYIEETSQGEWMVNESHKNAIKEYIKYKLAKKGHWKSFEGRHGKMMRGEERAFIKELELSYGTEIRHARAEDASDNPHEEDSYI